MNHLRWLSALAVALSHTYSNVFGIEPTSRGRGIINEIVLNGTTAVVVFFVLSGFLVGGKILQLFASEDVQNDWPHYLIDRFTRIFIVFWPALIFSLIVLYFTCSLVPRAPFVISGHWGYSIFFPLSNEFTFRIWVGAILLLNGFCTPLFQANGPIWSLSCEWFYYIGALAFVLILRRTFSASAMFIFFYTAFLLFFAFRHNHEALILSAAWILGLLAKFISERRVLRGRKITVVAILLFVLALFRDHHSPIASLLFAAPIALLISNRDLNSWRFGEKLAQKLAAFSYSLYLTHFPITILALAVLYRIGQYKKFSPVSFQGVFLTAAVLIVAVAFAWLFSIFTEEHTPQARQVLTKFLTPVLVKLQSKNRPQ